VAACLKPAWDAFCDGKYGWAPLAAHRWPERVTPKAPTRSIDELVHEKTRKKKASA
jgi:hypothetical protein